TRPRSTVLLFNMSLALMLQLYIANSVCRLTFHMYRFDMFHIGTLTPKFFSSFVGIFYEIKKIYISYFIRFTGYLMIMVYAC
ncbi:hypothetical protein L9F63_014066, partial [Diploptera punctata]